MIHEISELYTFRSKTQPKTFVSPDWYAVYYLTPVITFSLHFSTFSTIHVIYFLFAYQIPGSAVTLSVPRWRCGDSSGDTVTTERLLILLQPQRLRCDW